MPTARASRASSTSGRRTRSARRSRDLAEAAIAHFGVTEAGNFEGSNILVRATSDPAELAEIKAGLLAARAARVRPALDDKRLTSWNALMISALADAGAALERADYVAAAVACARFVETELVDDDGRLLRTFNRGQAKLPAYLEDHAYLLEAYLTLYEATFDDRWFTRARALADTILERFFDPERGGFFSVADDHTGLIARRKDLEDAPIPSGGSAAAFGLLRLARMTGEHRYEQAAQSLIELLVKVVPEHPLAFGHLLRAIDFSLAPVREVALAGDDVTALAQVVRGGFFPHVVLAGGVSDDGPAARGPHAGRRQAGRLRVPQLHVRAAGHDAEELEASLRIRRAPRTVQQAYGSSPLAPRRPHGQMDRPRRRRAAVRRARQPGGQVRGRPEERIVVVAARRTPSPSRRSRPSSACRAASSRPP